MIYPYNFVQKVNIDRLAVEIGNSLEITKSLHSISCSGNPVTTVISFKEPLPQAQIGVLNNLLIAHDNSPTVEADGPLKLDVPYTSDGHQKVAIYEPEGGSATIVTHNFDDKCSWYQYARPHNEILQGQGGENKVFKGTKTHWIDLENGRMYDEDNIMQQNQYRWKIKISVDNVLQTSGYTVNPVTGTVTFIEAQTGTVKAEFYYADKSYFGLRPRSGKKLSIKASEVQFGINSKLQSPFVFEVWTTFGVPFAIPGSQIVYKNSKDFISACNEGQGFIPKWGDMEEDTIVFPFNYARPKPMKASQGVEIRVYCRDHEQVPGTYTTATFYVTIDGENN